MRVVFVESTTKLTDVGERLGSLTVQLECTLEWWGNLTLTLQASSISRLPLHIGEGEAQSPRHILCVDQDGEMR